MMRNFNMHTIGKMLLIALAWCLWPASVHAQHYPCNGPGPGERLVGMAPGGPGVAPTPLCERVDSGGTPAPAPMSGNSYAAIAWHVDAADVWVDGNYVGANNVAEQGALDACNRVMGGGCTSAGTWWNSSIVIIRDRSGYFYKGWAGEGGAERDQVMADCSSKQLLPCEIFATIRASTNRRFPGPAVRKSFAASAWVVGGADDGYNASSMSRVATAAPMPRPRRRSRRAVMQPCVRAKPTRCPETGISRPIASVAATTARRPKPRPSVRRRRRGRTARSGRAQPANFRRCLTAGSRGCSCTISLT